jgi:hypothetical protein
MRRGSDSTAVQCDANQTGASCPFEVATKKLFVVGMWAWKVERHRARFTRKTSTACSWFQGQAVGSNDGTMDTQVGQVSEGMHNEGT